jgi:prepilin-type N-terminal cleavage/methylation domain-containing protein
MNNVSKERTIKAGDNMLMRNKVSRKQGGFTLIEIAIVLVIIGLLLGGVLKGQELINTARVRALNNSVDGITAAWFSFQDRYRAFPGDYSQASDNLPGVTTAADGDGDAIVDSGDEGAWVWVHLQAAGYITGSYTDETVTVLSTEYGCSTDICPDNGFGAGMNLSHGAHIYSESVKAAASQVDAHELITGHGVPIEVLAELDRKVDDGSADSGSMQLGAAGTVTTGNAWDANALASCQGTAVGLYGVKEPSSDCAAVFRNF